MFFRRRVVEKFVASLLGAPRFERIWPFPNYWRQIQRSSLSSHCQLASGCSLKRCGIAGGLGLRRETDEPIEFKRNLRCCFIPIMRVRSAADAEFALATGSVNVDVLD